MKQNEMNSQKAQELTKEELEQVNGGHRGQVPQVHQENKKPLGLCIKQLQ